MASTDSHPSTVRFLTETAQNHEIMAACASDETLTLYGSPIRRMVPSCDRCHLCTREAAKAIFHETSRDHKNGHDILKRLYSIGLKSNCQHCTRWNLLMSEVLDLHLNILNPGGRDDSFILNLVHLRAVALSNLGYKTI